MSTTGCDAGARGRGERAEQGAGEPEGTDDVGVEGELQLFALGVGERRERHGAEAGGVVDQDVHPAEPAGELEGDPVDGGLVGHVAGDADRARQLAREGVHPWRGAGDEADPGTAPVRGPDQGEAEAGGAAGHDDALAGQGISVG